MRVCDICEAVEALAPPNLAYNWDRSGLTIGNPNAPVSATLVALTVTREAFVAARKSRAQLIVSHHPVIWEPLRTLRSDEPHERLCVDLVKAGIACFAAHTNLDLVPGGMNDILAKRLGLVDVRPLLPAPHAKQIKLVTFVPESHLAKIREAVSLAGAGVIGDYSFCSFSTPGTGTFRPGKSAKPFSGRKLQINEEPERRFETLVPKARLDRVLQALFRAHPYEEVAYDVVSLENADPTIALGRKGRLAKPAPLKTFARAVRKALRVSHVRVVGDLTRKVETVGVIGGSGGSEIPHLSRDVDVLVTGDVKYDQALAALERGLTVVDATHSGTEKWIVPMVADHLRKAFPRLRVGTFIENEPIIALKE